MRLLIFLVILLATNSTNSAEPPTILIFGDSLSAGYGIEVDQSWAALLQTRLETQGYEHKVVNASISGETSAGGAARIERALAQFSPELLILELGANDGLRGFPPSKLRENLTTVIDQAMAAGADVVLLGIKIPTNYGPRYSLAFEAVFRQLAEEKNIPWIEFFMDGIALNDDLLQDDRIHPNAIAQPLLLDNAWPIISATLNNEKQ